MYLQVTEYENGKQILFGSNSMRTPFSVAVSSSDVKADFKGAKTVPEGSFVAAIGNTVRFLPRTRLAAAVATNSANITLKAPCQYFKEGDVIRAVAGYAELSLSGAAATGDIVIIRVNGTNYAITVGSTQTIAAATTLAAGLTIPNVTLTQVGTTGRVILVAKDSYKLEVYSSNPALVARINSSEPGYFGDAILPLGTIQSIGAPNNTNERVVTLAGNAAYALPIDAPVGVSVDKFLGIYPAQLDLSQRPTQHIAPYYHADGVYEKNLPYVDMQIARSLHGLNLNKRFYANV